MSSERVAQWLRDILDNIASIKSYVEGFDLDGLRADRMRLDAVERCLQRITEAVIRVGPKRMADIAPEVPSSEVRGFGNVLRHHYDTLSSATVWDTVKHDLPILRAACERALRQISGLSP